MKYFIITIDTEGDNLWKHNQSEQILTENARYIPRFQTLCEKYNFKPVYLVNYEMACDDYLVNFLKKVLSENNCEIGIHLHAWNNPPYYELQKGKKDGGLPYLFEYPRDIMLKKFTVLYKLLMERFNTEIVSHRSGRWAMNQDYFDILMEHDIKIDCSVTPHVSWELTKGFTLDSKGSNFLSSPENQHIIKHSSQNNTILEIPVTIRNLRSFSLGSIKHPRTFFKNIRTFSSKKPIWLRPTGSNLKDMFTLVEHIKNSNDDYLMFMLHSSELMPNGSPTFKTKNSIEHLYSDLGILFNKVSRDFTGITLKDYAVICRKY
jgi:hypothetical protein